MKSLPAKGLARKLCAVAIAGCALSLAVNAISMLGFHSKPLLYFERALFLAIFLMAIPVMFALGRLYSEFSYRDTSRMTFNTRLAERVRSGVEAKAPPWLRNLSHGLMRYTGVLFVLFLLRHYADKSPGDLDEIRLMSAFAALFYAFFAEFLAAYVGSEHPLDPEEFRDGRLPPDAKTGPLSRKSSVTPSQLILIWLLLVGGGCAWYAFGPADGIGIGGVVFIAMIVTMEVVRYHRSREG